MKHPERFLLIIPSSMCAALGTALAGSIIDSWGKYHDGFFTHMAYVGMIIFGASTGLAGWCGILFALISPFIDEDANRSGTSASSTKVP